MKILLTAINAKYIHSNLAVYSLQAYAGEYRPNVEIAEFTINNSKDYILEEIYRRKPDVLCFSVYIWNLDYVESIARTFHKICPDVPIWVGGPEVSYEVRTFLDNHPYIQGVMIGEGEETFKELCGWYVEKQGLAEKKDLAGTEGLTGIKRTNAGERKTYRTLSEIAGLAYRCKGAKIEDSSQEMPSIDICRGKRQIDTCQEKRQLDTCQEKAADQIIFTSPRQPLDMSTIPFAYNTSQDFSNRIIYYESSRGCPFSCSYCLSSVDKHLRFRELELVKKELQFFIDQKVPQIKFVDRTFNCNHMHAMAIWEFIRDHDNGITNFHFEIAADLLNDEELNLIAGLRPGLIQLEIGVQSTNYNTIHEIHRTMKLDQVKEFVNRVHSGMNVHQHLDLIVGLPKEDYESFRNSFNEIYALKPNQLQLGFLKVLKGSYLYEHAAEYGICCHDEPPYEVLSTNWLSYEDVLRLKRVEEMVEVYYNSGQYEVTMKVLEAISREQNLTPFDLFQSLGDFYDRKGYFGMSHSRIRRCEILLEFFETQSTEATDLTGLLQEALTFDLYYRENCKSRPAWAPDPGTFKRENREFCKNGKMSHLEPFHYRFPDKRTLTLEAVPEYMEDRVWALFSYDKRDPLDHQARVEYVTIMEKR